MSKSKKAEIVSIDEEVLSAIKSNRNILIKYCGNQGPKQSFYNHLRNSLAHGNIIWINDELVFFSFSKNAENQMSLTYNKSKTDSESDRLVFY